MRLLPDHSGEPKAHSWVASAHPYDTAHILIRYPTDSQNCDLPATIQLLMVMSSCFEWRGRTEPGASMVNRETWRREVNGDLSVQVPGLRLVVQKSDTYTRYEIVQRGSDHHGSSSEIMLSSGTEPSADAAIVAAERVAARVAVMLSERTRQRQKICGGSE